MREILTGEHPWARRQRGVDPHRFTVRVAVVIESLFPSGPWTGFYNYYPGDRHWMDLQLIFARGSMAGDGTDDLGRFIIRGRYDADTRECHWTKSYLGRHDVFYRGFREGKGIWGTWEISILASGGFHIWPRQAGEGEPRAERAEAPEPVEAVGVLRRQPDGETPRSALSRNLAQTTGRVLLGQQRRRRGIFVENESQPFPTQAPSGAASDPCVSRNMSPRWGLEPGENVVLQRCRS
jgi:hypothetical protein